MAYNFKGKFQRPLLPTIVVDDFFETPDLWRRFALSLDYYKGDRGTWPGVRTDLLNDIDPSLLKDLNYKLLYYVPWVKEFTSNDVSFQLVGEKWGEGWIHDDDPQHVMAGVIYLNKEPIQDAGTIIYNQQPDPSLERYTKIFTEDVLDEERNNTEKYNKYRREQQTKFKKTINAESRYNRCIMFDPRQWHSAYKYFGSTDEDSRLTLVFFANGVLDEAF